MVSDDIIRARLFLLRATEPPAPAVHDYVTVHGPVEALARIRHGSAPAAVISEITRPDARIDDDLGAIEDGTARLVTPEHEDWPARRVGTMTGVGAPLALWTRGRGSLATLTAAAVTLTGALACSAYGTAVATDFGRELARAGFSVVSGGGFGVPEAAMRAALAEETGTVVVLPCGVDQTRPYQHGRLYQGVLEQGGLLVSEYPIGIKPGRRRHHARCRLLAALTETTVIVEAGRRCIALLTAHAATALGRRLYGVPGSIYSVTSSGVNELLRTGAATAINSPTQIIHQNERR